MPVANPEQSIFLAALELPTPAERAAYLKGACGADPALLANVQELLAAHEKDDGFLDRPPPNATVDEPPVTERPGSCIGPYKLLQQIGEGGMGVVFRAEQDRPVRRKVALKIIKPGRDSKQVVARFEAERQALAMMDHTNIAKVFDAGTTESGRPYFVMELVHGVPITEYCDANKLTPRQRLELFVPVCQAAQHAHQKGIIHRDIKPSNILVTMYDDKPVPKVIDFGVAKAIEQKLTERTLFTQYGVLVGAFEYMSPEQAEMNAFGVDTRSDIYALGVLLYELLTGSTPLERQRLREAAFDEIRRIIKEEEPQKPSVRLSTSGTLAKVAEARKTEPAKLSRLVRGELDWVVMKCLEKDRSRRYETANALARDVARYLADEPVEACPPSAWYRARKIAKRYKGRLAVAGAFAVLLVAGLVAVAWQWRAERAARQEATEARKEAEELGDNNRRLAVESQEERDRARSNLYRSLVREAQAIRLAGQAGFRAEVFDPLRQAAGLRVPERDRDELRREATLAMGSPIGLRPIRLPVDVEDLVGAGAASHAPLHALWTRDGKISLYRTSDGARVVTLPGPAAGQRGFNALLLGPAGRRLYASGEKRTVVWEHSPAGDWRQVSDREIKIERFFATEGGMLGVAAGSGNALAVWDLDTGKRVTTLTLATSPWRLRRGWP